MSNCTKTTRMLSNQEQERILWCVRHKCPIFHKKFCKAKIKMLQYRDTDANAKVDAKISKWRLLLDIRGVLRQVFRFIAVLLSSCYCHIDSNSS